MGRLLNLQTQVHKKTERNYFQRMKDKKPECARIARRFDKDFFDGERKYGYGGYKYDGRWESVARGLIEFYNLPQDAKILDVGCGKGFLLYEFKKLLPDAVIKGFDISKYSIENAKKEVRETLFTHKAEDAYSFKDEEFDLVVSLMTLHNLWMDGLKRALSEIERVGKNKYVTVEAYRNEKELFNLQCWALTCEQFFRPQEWVWLFNEFGYTGDYEFIYFE